MKPLQPGIYKMTIDRVRKVRNKDKIRIHMTITEGPEEGTKLDSVLEMRTPQNP